MKSTKAVILAAGQGSRLLPLTEKRPKCLVELSGKTVLGWQIEALAAAGVGEIVVVTGFGAEAVDEHLIALVAAHPDITIRTRYNPFYKSSDNLASCWLVRDEFQGNCMLINGDTLFSPRIARTLLEAPDAPAVITIDQKDAYDDDDMKTELNGHYLKDVGKTLDPAKVSGEAIGMIRLSGDGGPKLADALDQQIRSGSGLRKWYLSAVADLARDNLVTYHSIKGETWGEIDDHNDLDIAAKMVVSESFAAL